VALSLGVMRIIGSAAISVIVIGLFVYDLLPLCCIDQLQPAKSDPGIHFHLRRPYSGRPSSSMRFSDATAMATSVVCRRAVRERSASPITRL
jgi:hypothetical protein